LNGLLEVCDLTVRFGNSFSVGPVSVATGPGILYLEGPNGGGKTTLLRAMAGELEPAAGSVKVGGLDVQTSIEARRRIALVPSAPELPEFLSVAEACEFTASLRGARSWDYTDYLQALHLDPDLPLGSASAGQRRKTELVCGLTADPDVLLLDETFAHLDADAVATLTRWVTSWASARLIVLTHHGSVPVTPTLRLHIEGARAGRAGE
jgi:ABC-type multidrug transport system ATPase subunit